MITVAAWPLRSASLRNSSSASVMSVGCACSPLSPRANARYASSMPAISSTSLRMPSTSGLSPISASSSLKRVRMVRRSWLTPASIAVRCSIERSMRAFISRKACAARRTSRRATGAEIRRLAALAETFGGVRQPQDRLDLVAQEQHHDDQQDRRGPQHPEDEDFRIRRIGRAALREHPHHGVVELDADFHQIGAADGIDPERSRDLAAELHRQRLVEQREERLRAGRRHVADGQEIHHQPEPLLGDAPQLRAVLVLRIGLVDVDQAWRHRPPRRRTAAASPCSSAAP